MEENIPTEEPEIPGADSAEEPQENISLSDAITGVITAPSETFESVKASTKKNYWIVPILVFIVLYVASSFLVLNDEDLYTEIKTKQTDAVKERLDNMVKDGKLSREQANEQLDKMDKQMSKSNPIFYVFAAVGPIFTTFIILFLEGLIFFGVLKVFKGTATYMNVLSVLGLAAIIECIQTIIDTVLAIVMGRLNSNIGPALLFKADSVGESMFKFLAHFDLLTIWLLIVVGIGLAKVSQLKTSITMLVVFVLWLIWISATSFLKIGFFGM